MRKIAFGYSTRCNSKCSHCVAAGEEVATEKMELAAARELIEQMAEAGVGGISFTAGEPFIYFDDLLELIGLCSRYNIYTRVVTNSFWAGSSQQTEEYLRRLKQQGLCQLRLSCSRWHQEYVALENVVNAARGCMAAGVAYYISFVTDFSEKDDQLEDFLRHNKLLFFPEPVIYSGRAGSFGRKRLLTDYQENCCSMNPYLAPDLSMYGCCDGGVQFDTTDFFHLGSLTENSIAQLLARSEQFPLYRCIRTMGITAIAFFAGMRARDIVTYRKCDLCKLLFDNPDTLSFLQEAATGDIWRWAR